MAIESINMASASVNRVVLQIASYTPIMTPKLVINHYH